MLKKCFRVEEAEDIEEDILKIGSVYEVVSICKNEVTVKVGDKVEVAERDNGGDYLFSVEGLGGIHYLTNKTKLTRLSCIKYERK